MRHSGKFGHYAVPLAMVVIAGLVHAFFEDWLFAVETISAFTSGLPHLL